MQLAVGEPPALCEGAHGSPEDRSRYIMNQMDRPSFPDVCRLHSQRTAKFERSGADKDASGNEDDFACHYALGRETPPVLLGRRDSVSAVLAYEFACRLEQWTLVSSLRRVHVARFLFLFLCCEAPSGPRRSSNRWCPGTGLGIIDTKVSVPLRASTAQQSAVSPCEQLSPKSERHFFS